jgi:hypothetical protein
MPLATHYDDPILDEIARAVFALFPSCMRCGKRIEQFEDADLLVHSNRVVHRGSCPRFFTPTARRPQE